MEPPCRKHDHPSLRAGVTRDEARREFADLYHQAGYEGPIDLAWTDELRETHNENTRRYAQVMPFLEVPHFELAPQTTRLPLSNRRALMAHEIGHVLDPSGDEDEADAAARRALGIRIRYDHRWPGKGLQTTRDNPSFDHDDPMVTGYSRSGQRVGERARDAHRRWSAHGDEEAFQEWIAMRERLGLPREPNELASWEDLDDVEGLGPSLAAQRARPTHRRKRMKGAEARKVVAAWLASRGWRLDPRATGYNDVWISASGQRRFYFKRSHVVFEIGGRGQWARDYKVHKLYEPLGTIDFAERLLNNTRTRLARHVTDPYAKNPRRREKGYLLDQLLADPVVAAHYGRRGDELVNLMGVAQRVIANEPMRWYFEESEKEYWNEQEEFRNVAPVYPVLWIELQAPRFLRSDEYGVTPWPEKNWKKAGVLMVTSLMEDVDDDEVTSNFPEAKWITRASVFTSADQFGPAGIKWTFIYGVNHDGSISLGSSGGFLTHAEGTMNTILRGHSAAEQQEVSNFYKGPWRVALLALYFMHAKGTTLKPVRVSQKVAKARRKKGQPTGEGYKVLDVGLGARRTLKEAVSEGGGSSLALSKHLRRGNFAVYSGEKPHVSGFTGSMWRSPTVVGRGDEEVKERDYRVKRKRKHKRKKRRNPEEKFLPARMQTMGLPPRRVSFGLLARGEAPLIYLPEGFSARTLPRVTEKLKRILSLHPSEGGLATPDAWEDLLAALGGAGSLYAVDRNGERWKVLGVATDPGGFTGEVQLLHQGRRGRFGPRWIDLEHAYGKLLPMVVYKGRR